MANGDGFSEVGGGGSVVYRVTVKNGNAPTVVPPGGPPQQREAKGKDDYAPGTTGAGHYFEIRIKLPNPNYRLPARKVGGVWTIYLPISQTLDPDQTHVGWAVKDLPSPLNELTLGALI